MRYSDSFVVTTFEEEKTTTGQNLYGLESMSAGEFYRGWA